LLSTYVESHGTRSPHHPSQLHQPALAIIKLLPPPNSSSYPENHLPWRAPFCEVVGQSRIQITMTLELVQLPPQVFSPVLDGARKIFAVITANEMAFRLGECG